MTHKNSLKTIKELIKQKDFEELIRGACIKNYKDVNFKNLVTFFLLCLTSPVLFFDNIEPIDYVNIFKDGELFYGWKEYDMRVGKPLKSDLITLT